MGVREREWGMREAEIYGRKRGEGLNRSSRKEEIKRDFWEGEGEM